MRRNAVAGLIIAVLGVVAVSVAPGEAVVVTPALLGNVDPALPSTAPTKVAVVANSAPVGADVGILVRNGTTNAVDHLQVRATAKAPGGGTIVRASTGELVPGTLAPGALAIGNLEFGRADLATGTSFSFKVTSKPATRKAEEAALEVRDALLSRPMEGPVAQQMAVTVANLGAKSYSGPVTVTVMCFGEARNPAFVTTATVKKAKVAAGATTPVTVALALLCPKYMVGASAELSRSAETGLRRLASRLVEIIAGFLAVGVVIAIAAFLVAREAGRIARDPPPALFDVDDAYAWVVDHLPDDVAATLTPGDVRRILDFQVEFFKRKGVSSNGSTAYPPGNVVIGGSETVEFILERCAATGEAYLPEQVFGVIDTQLSYLRAIGAVGPPAKADPDDPKTAAD